MRLWRIIERDDFTALADVYWKWQQEGSLQEHGARLTALTWAPRALRVVHHPLRDRGAETGFTSR